ncbi:MAG: gamma carbonic anhydrase family protein [Bdellovibrionales bacterium]
MIQELSEGRKPIIKEKVFIAPSADIIGSVTIEEECSIWYQVVIRGDVMPVTIGRQSNIQDQTVIHGTYKKAATTIGERVSIGHRVTLHGCEIEHHCLIGMGSIVMDGAVIGHHSIVGAGSLVTEGKKVPPYQLIVGSPARVKRPLTEEEIEFLNNYADKYLFYKSWYQSKGESDA